MFIKKIFACLIYGKKKAFSFIPCYICGNITIFKYFEILFSHEYPRCNNCIIK
jgi:hypothetical protein